jgi:hypothetical protein
MRLWINEPGKGEVAVLRRSRILATSLVRGRLELDCHHAQQAGVRRFVIVPVFDDALGLMAFAELDGLIEPVVYDTVEAHGEGAYPGAGTEVGTP